ncbi:recombinase family protein [Streptomyces nigrescens]
MTIHAAGYDRQSQERGNRSVASPVAQRSANRGEAERRAKAGAELTWVGHYSEAPGTSAFSGVERPEFNRLLQDCRMGRVNMIIVLYISRFSRADPLDAIPVVSELLNLGVTIVSVTEGEFRKGNLMDLIHLIMRLDASHSESKNKSTAVKTAHDLAKSLGGYVGKAPYGFEMVPETRYTDDRKPVVVQLLKHRKSPRAGKFKNEPDVIRWVWKTIKAHMHEPFKPTKENRNHPGSLTGICRTLEEEKVPTRGALVGKRTKDSIWDPATLKRILRDPRIAGMDAEPVYKTDKDGNKTRNIQGYRIKRDPVTMEPTMLECGGIISVSDWHELQEWLDGRGRGKGLSRGQALLTAMDILWCECGNVMVGHSKTDVPSKSHYHCKRRRKLPGQHEGSCTMVMHALDAYVAGRIFALIRTAEGDEDTLAILHEVTKRFGKLTEAPETTGERSSLLAERSDAVQALEELYDDREAGGYSGAIGRKRFLQAEGKLSFRVQGAEERLAELDAAVNPRLPIQEWMPEDPGADPIGPGSWWDAAPIEDKRAFVRLWVDRIEVRKNPPGGSWHKLTAADRVTITWAEPEEDDDEN